MGFTTDNIPYPLNIGIDISNIINALDNNLISDCVMKLEENNLDFIISPISSFNKNERINALNEMLHPIFLDDFILLSHEWKNKFVSELHHEDLLDLSSNENLIYQDFEYANHIYCRSVIFDYISYESKELFLLSKMIKNLSYFPDRQINFIFDFNYEDLLKWKKLNAIVGYAENLSIILNILPDLPEELKF
jgi:hypothetical protein